MTVTSFRWYLYGPAHILRGALLFVVVFWVIDKFTASECMGR